jgi:hypothetical protein
MDMKNSKILYYGFIIFDKFTNRKRYASNFYSLKLNIIRLKFIYILKNNF